MNLVENEHLLLHSRKNISDNLILTSVSNDGQYISVVCA